MPSELRHIVFRPAEVVEAVEEYFRRLGTPLPPGSIVECGPVRDDGFDGKVSFSITIAPDAPWGDPNPWIDAEGRTEVVVEGPALAAALILFCRSRRIPMPATADKSLQRIGSQICLVATLSPKPDSIRRTKPAHP